MILDIIAWVLFVIILILAFIGANTVISMLCDENTQETDENGEEMV